MCGGMLGVDLLDKLVNNVNNLSKIFDKILPANSSMINEHNLEKVVSRDRRWEGPRRHNALIERREMME